MKKGRFRGVGYVCTALAMACVAILLALGACDSSPGMPLAAQLLHSPSESLVQQAEADHVPTDQELALVAVFWATLADGDMTKTVPDLWVSTDLLQQVAQLANEYQHFFQAQPDGSFTTLSAGTVMVVPSLIGSTSRVLNDGLSSCLTSCLSPPTWQDVEETLSDVISVLDPLEKDGNVAINLVTKVLDARSTGKTLAEAILSVVNQADAQTIAKDVFEGALGVAGAVSEAPWIATVGGAYAAIKLSYKFSDAISNYKTCLMQCPPPDAGPPDAGPPDAGPDAPDAGDGAVPNIPFTVYFGVGTPCSADATITINNATWQMNQLGPWPQTGGTTKQVIGAPAGATGTAVANVTCYQYGATSPQQITVNIFQGYTYASNTLFWTQTETLPFGPSCPCSYTFNYSFTVPLTQ